MTYNQKFKGIDTIIGKTFTRLTVLSYHGKKDKRNSPIVNCRCLCGKPIEVLLHSLKTGNTKSCGCLSQEKKENQRPRTQLTEDDEIEICNKYIAKVSINDIVDMYHIGLIRANKILKKHGIVKKELSKILRDYNNKTLNEEAFDSINENSAYWIGFLMSDGNVFKNHISFKLQNSDFAHIEKFKSFVSSNHNIKTEETNGRKYHSIRFRSKYMSQSLSIYGIVPNKVFITKTPELLKFNRDYWRGMIDGDGTVGIWKGRETIGLTGTLDIIQEFLDFCQTIVSHNHHPYKNQNSYHIRFSHRLARKITKYLYEDCSIYLDRKYETALKIINYKKGQVI